MRTVQDPDTFRDLLYAVVTGQRNHEDSRRKGLASAAGRKRAAERGDYIGSQSDGYMRVIEVDDTGAIKRRLEIDPARSPVIEMIFAMALRRKSNNEIARAINAAGWLTKPARKNGQPKPWDLQCVRDVLKNVRYAGLASYGGEVVGRGNWPAYITERQYQRLRARRAQRAPASGPPRHEPYILSRLAHCGSCGSLMHCITGELRQDGTFARRYTCSSHTRDRHSGQCERRAIDADVIERMFVSTLSSLLDEGAEEQVELGPMGAPAQETWAHSAERERVLQAVRDGDDRQIDAALDELLTRRSPKARMLQRVASSTRNTRQLETVQRFEAWASAEPQGRTEASRTEARELNRILRSWFSTVTLEMDARNVVIAAHRRSQSDDNDSHSRAEARFDRREWMRGHPSPDERIGSTQRGRTRRSSGPYKPGPTQTDASPSRRTGFIPGPTTRRATRCESISRTGTRH